MGHLGLRGLVRALICLQRGQGGWHADCPQLPGKTVVGESQVAFNRLERMVEPLGVRRPNQGTSFPRAARSRGPGESQWRNFPQEGYYPSCLGVSLAARYSHPTEGAGGQGGRGPAPGHPNQTSSGWFPPCVGRRQICRCPLSKQRMLQPSCAPALKVSLQGLGAETGRPPPGCRPLQPPRQCTPRGLRMKSTGH